jgi:nucleoside diphosphate-linked moiety X motif protein 19
MVASPLSAAHNVMKSSGKLENSNNDFKILLLRRSSKSSFMPSKMVFPGGALQEVDHSSAWQTVYKNVIGQSLDEISHELSSSKSCLPLLTEKREWTFNADIAFRICAIRETFEESGILLGTNRTQRSHLTRKDTLPFRSASDLIVGDAAWRKKVEKDSLQFLAMCQELSVVPDVWSLKVWRNWLTPVFAQVTGPPKKPRRFDTMFYVACVDCDEIPNALPDDTESTHAEVSLQ